MSRRRSVGPGLSDSNHLSLLKDLELRQRQVCESYTALLAASSAEDRAMILPLLNASQKVHAETHNWLGRVFDASRTEAPASDDAEPSTAPLLRGEYAQTWPDDEVVRARRLVLLLFMLSMPVVMLCVAFDIALSPPSRDQHGAVAAEGLQQHVVFALYVSGSLLVFTLVAASAPEGPPPGTEKWFDTLHVCIAATAWHIVGSKYEETRREESDHPNSRLGLSVGIALFATLAALAQHALGPRYFWAIFRTAVTLCAALRLVVIGIIWVHGGAATYPPGRLPLPAALAIPILVLTLCAMFVAPVRQRVARTCGISRRVTDLLAMDWLPMRSRPL